MSLPLVPKLLFGNALFRNSVSVAGGMAERNEVSQPGRSQTGVWERGTVPFPDLGTGPCVLRTGYSVLGTAYSVPRAQPAPSPPPSLSAPAPGSSPPHSPPAA